MIGEIDLAKFKKKVKRKDRYAKPLQSVQGKGIATAFIEQAVNDAEFVLRTGR